MIFSVLDRVFRLSCDIQFIMVGCIFCHRSLIYGISFRLYKSSTDNIGVEELPLSLFTIY